jgi:hypothetical protein
LQRAILKIDKTPIRIIFPNILVSRENIEIIKILTQCQKTGINNYAGSPPDYHHGGSIFHDAGSG